MSGGFGHREIAKASPISPLVARILSFFKRCFRIADPKNGDIKVMFDDW